MIELGLMVLSAITMGRIADYEQRSPWIWGGGTAAAMLLAAFVIPLPYARVGIVFFGGLGLMIAMKFFGNRS